MKQKSLVLDLQDLASQELTSIAELLRKALLVASKLKSTSLRKWVESELHGYDGSVPDYRKVRAQLMVKNPVAGLMPFYIDNDTIMDQICNVEIRDPIGSLVHIMNSREPGRGFLWIPLPSKTELLLMQHQDSPIPMQPMRTVAGNQIAAILDEVRSTILEWALKLEEEGILGDGMTFSKEDQAKAAEIESITIHNLQAIFGSISGGTVIQEQRINVRRGDLASLRKFLALNGIPETDIAELEVAIKQDPSPSDRQAFGPRVSAWIGKMTTRAAQGLWKTGVSVASDLLANGIWAYYF